MSKPSWEEEIEEWLKRIEEKIDTCCNYLETCCIEETPKKTSKPQTRKRTPVTQTFEPGKYLKAIEGSLIDSPRQVDRDIKGITKSVTNFTLNTDLGLVRVGLWEDLSYEAVEFKVGDTIILTNMYIKPPYQDLPQITSTKNTEIE